MRVLFFIAFFLPVSLLSACTSDGGKDPLAPDSTVSSVEEPVVLPNKSPSRAMVVTANPLATNAGVAVLEAGGSAIDAAVAIESVLSLVEPQSSGLAGGGFMMYFDAESKKVTVYDGRETAPAGATADMFVKADGSVMGFIEAKNSGLSVGVPGIVSALSLAHDDHGLRPWNSLFDSAISLAEEGFDVSPRLKNFLDRFQQHIPATLSEGPVDAYQYFFNEAGVPKTRLVNPDYAKALRAISKDADAFYKGDLAQDIVDAVTAEPRAGSMTLSDIANYKARREQALCVDYKSLSLCGPPPPSSWIAVGMTMGMLASVPRPAYSAENPKDWAIVGEALRLAYADRDQYIADPDFVSLPIKGMLNKTYLAQRAATINPEQAIKAISYGDPWAFEPKDVSRYGDDLTDDRAGTTHFTVVDAKGNAIAVTASVESIFGSTRMAGGMFLNNQLTDFSRSPVDSNGQRIANAVEPGKRPRSSMSPTLVLDEDGEFLMSTGSPGGNSIISYTLKTLVAVLDWGLSPQEAINLPNMVARGDKVRIERERASPEILKVLNDYGFNVQESKGENSGLSMILRKPNGDLEGGVDPRREGTIGVPVH